MDLISMSLVDLIRWYDYTDESAHHASEMLLQDITGRSHLFSSEHIKDMFTAFDSACSLHDLLVTAEIDFNAEEHDEPSDDLAMYSPCWELMSRTPGTANASDDAEFADDCDDEACERMIELLRSLQDEDVRILSE
jgi:hypothetical protein